MNASLLNSFTNRSAKMCKIYNYALVVASYALIVAGLAAVPLPDIDRLSSGDSLGENFPSSLSSVGTVEGKSYFADNFTLLSWTAAGRYCRDLGMELASITSANQAAMLNQSYAEHFSGYFWISGRDAHELRQFSWDKTGEELNPDYVEILNGRSNHATCVEYVSQPGESGLFSESCSYEDTILCEMLTPSKP